MTRAFPLSLLLAFACASGKLPAQLRGYNIVVEETDSQTVELARALRQQGIKVRSRLRGGSGPTAAVIYFTYRDPARGELTWFHLRFADTRTGAIVAAAAVPLDSTTETLRARAQAAVRALTP